MTTSESDSKQLKDLIAEREHLEKEIFTDIYFKNKLDMVCAARENDDESIWRVFSRKIGYFCMQLI